MQAVMTQKFCTNLVPNAGTDIEIGEDLCNEGLLLKQREIGI